MKNVRIAGTGRPVGRPVKLDSEAGDIGSRHTAPNAMATEGQPTSTDVPFETPQDPIGLLHSGLGNGIGPSLSIGNSVNT